MIRIISMKDQLLLVNMVKDQISDLFGKKIRKISFWTGLFCPKIALNKK